MQYNKICLCFKEKMESEGVRTAAAVRGWIRVVGREGGLKLCWTKDTEMVVLVSYIDQVSAHNIVRVRVRVRAGAKVGL